MQEYCLGFVCSLDAQKVLLIQKQRPAWQKGQYNGIGGKLEEGETPLQAMVRECKEEADLDLMESEWEEIGALSDDHSYKVHVFCARANLDLVRAVSDEALEVVQLGLVSALPLVPPGDKILQKVQERMRFLSSALKPADPNSFGDLF